MKSIWRWQSSKMSSNKSNNNPRKLCILGVPSCLGGNIFGCDKGPDALRKVLIPALKDKQINYRDYGNVNVPKECVITDPKEKCLPEIAKIQSNLARFIKSEKIFANNNFPVLIGGDHSLNYRFIVESASHLKKQQRKNLGLIWFDAHGDFNTPKITPSGNIHGMVLSALAGRGLNKDFNSNTKSTGKIKEQNICIFGARDLDLKEKELLKKTKVHIVTITKIQKDGIKKTFEHALNQLLKHTDSLHLSFDLDVFDPTLAPGTGTPVKDGLKKKDLKIIFKILRRWQRAGKLTIVSADIMEYNPLKDKNQKTAGLASELITSLAKIHSAK